MVSTNKSMVEVLKEGVELVRDAKRSQNVMDEWFLVQQIRMEETEAVKADGINPEDAAGQAELLCRMAILPSNAPAAA